jgi:hypothetical protein
MNQGHTPGRGQPESPKLPHAVFISHSSDESPAAGGVCVALEAAGIHCWIAPRDVLAGRPYSVQITEAIRRAEILLLVLSQASNRSKQVLREVERAAHFKVDLLAFKIEPVEPLDGSTSVVTTPTPSVAAVTPVVVATSTPSPIGLVLATPTATVALATPALSPNSIPSTSGQDALILRILKAMETHDYRTLLVYTLDKETDYSATKIHPVPSSNKI